MARSEPVTTTPLPASDARDIADATLRAARAADARPLAVVVLDAGGHLQVLLREDGAGFLRPAIAIAKASGALGMGESSRQLATRAQHRPEFFASLTAVADGRMALSPGGVLVTDGESRIVAAVGVSGDTSDMDERCAVIGIEAVGCYAVPGAT